MIDSIRIDYDGPDGTWLVIDDDQQDELLRFQIGDDALGTLDTALGPWREHQSEGAFVRAQFDAHRRSGRCTAWVSGSGACGLEANHEGEHR